MSIQLTIQNNGKPNDIQIGQNDISFSFGLESFAFNSNSLFSNSFTIPYECNANKLSFVADINSKGGLDLKCERLTAQLSSKGFCRTGSFYLDGTTTRYVNGQVCNDIQGQFISGFNEFIIDDCKLCDLDLGEFAMTGENVQSTFNSNPYDGTNPIWFPLSDWGGLNYSSSADFPFRLLPPHVHDKAIIKALENKTGKKIKSSFFDSEYFRRHTLSFGNECEYVQKFHQSTVNVGAANIQDEVIGFGSNGLGVFPVFEVGTNFIECFTTVGPSGLAWNILQSDTYTFKFEIEADNTTATTFGSAGITLLNTATNTPITFFPIQDGTNTYQIEVDLIQGDQFQLQGIGDFDILQGSEFSVCKTQDIAQNAILQIGQSLPCKSVSEFMQDWAIEANLVSFYDEKNNCLIIEPMFDTVLPETGEKIKGFYSLSNTENWTDKIQCVDYNADWNPYDYNRTLQYGYCPDENDFCTPNDFLECEYQLCDRYPQGEPTDMRMSCISTISNYNPEGVTDINIPRQCTEYMEEGEWKRRYLIDNPNASQVEVDIAYVDYLRDNDTRYCSDKMKRLYKVGMVDGGWFYYGNDEAGEALDQYPYGTNLDENINMGFCDANTQGRVNTFYGRFLNAINGGELLTLTLLLDETDIQDLESLFRKGKYLETANGCGIYILQNIQGYAFDEKNLVTATFLGTF